MNHPITFNWSTFSNCKDDTIANCKSIDWVQLADKLTGVTEGPRGQKGSSFKTVGRATLHGEQWRKWTSRASVMATLSIRRIGQLSLDLWSPFSGNFIWEVDSAPCLGTPLNRRLLLKLFFYKATFFENAIVALENQIYQMIIHEFSSTLISHDDLLSERLKINSKINKRFLLRSFYTWIALHA